VAAVLAHAERCRAEHARLEQAEVATAELERALAEAESERDARAADLSAARAAAGPKLAKAVAQELAVLAMPDADFAVALEPRDEVGPSGAERVELMLAPNPGVPAAPVRDSASGGELSRVMLALMTVATARGPSGGGHSASGDGAELLVFDEVDAGVGGQAARAVGERLRGLGGSRQVLCITHLPQIAALADVHFTIEKSAAGKVTQATVARVEGDAVVAELVRMLGADAGDQGARDHARELLAA
jgi:DNA repair protein RecN (Recombination protein N)